MIVNQNSQKKIFGVFIGLIGLVGSMHNACGMRATTAVRMASRIVTAVPARLPLMKPLAIKRTTQAETTPQFDQLRTILQQMKQMKEIKIDKEVLQKHFSPEEIRIITFLKNLEWQLALEKLDEQHLALKKLDGLYVTISAKTVAIFSVLLAFYYAYLMSDVPGTRPSHTPSVLWDDLDDDCECGTPSDDDECEC